LSERRAIVRCHRNHRALCSGVSTYERLWARVRDISVNGIGLIQSSGIEPGTVLTIEMRTKTQGASQALLARAVHATKRTESSWLVGCEFLTRLTAEQVRELL